jgi:hypothetical protein
MPIFLYFIWLHCFTKFNAAQSICPPDLKKRTERVVKQFRPVHFQALHFAFTLYLSLWKLNLKTVPLKFRIFSKVKRSIASPVENELPIK